MNPTRWAMLAVLFCVTAVLMAEALGPLEVLVVEALGPLGGCS